MQHHFVELATRQPGVYYGYYFLELADYFGKEGTDEKEMMNLLYVTIKAILNPHIEDRLVRCIYELRTMVIGRDAAAVPVCGLRERAYGGRNRRTFFSRDEHGILCADCKTMAMDRKRISAAALYAMRYIAVSPLAKLYTFTVRDDVLRELERHIYRYTELNTDKRFKSLEIHGIDEIDHCRLRNNRNSKAGQDATRMEISLKNHEDTSIIRPKM